MGGLDFLNIFGMSDIGRKRKSNQDSFDYAKIGDECCFAFVCDGMGGQNAGEVASGIVKNLFYEKIIENLKNNFLSIKDVEKIIMDCYLFANSVVFEKSNANEKFKGMGTTCVSVFIFEDNLMVFSVGDSRAYLFSNDVLKQLTVDHSYVQTLVDCGEITKEQAKTHPRKNEITKAVGISKYIEIDFKNIPLNKGDIVLLCTDGLTNSCGDVEIENLIKSRTDLSGCVKDLISMANASGGHDNITIILIEV